MVANAWMLWHDTAMVEITYCHPINRTSDRRKVNKKLGRPSKLLLNGWSCDVCPKRIKCKELCPPMEWVVQQTEIEPGAEQPANNPDYERTSIKWPSPPTTSEIIFTMFFFDQLTQQEIARKLYISQQYVSKAINKQKQILIENLRK